MLDCCLVDSGSRVVGYIIGVFWVKSCRVYHRGILGQELGEYHRGILGLGLLGIS